MTRALTPVLASMVAALALASPSLLAHAQAPDRGEQAPPADRAPVAAQDPDNDQFDKLVEAQARYRSIAENGGWPALADGDAMKPGGRYDCARLQALEKRLEVEGYRGGTAAPAATRPVPSQAAPGPDTAGEEPGAKRGSSAQAAGAGGDKGRASAGTGATRDCEYGSELAAAVEAFQHDRYLAVDGVVGGQTQRQLAKPVEDVLAKIDYALKRWRANAANMSGSYIVVNIPAFELAVYEGRSEVLRMSVIVGLPDWQTPELSDKVDSIVVNPSWNIPKSIAEQEVLPKSRKDRGYLAREGIVSDGDGTLSQKPGPRNPLGRLKFMMPNREDVYLHDTPGRQKFASPARAFSHGCVRVEKPLDLAELLLKDDPAWPRQAIESAIGAKATKTVKLAKPMAVHLLYIPAVVSSEGRLQVAPDIYDKIGNASDERALEPAPTDEEEFLGGP